MMSYTDFQGDVQVDMNYTFRCNERFKDVEIRGCSQAESQIVLNDYNAQIKLARAMREVERHNDGRIGDSKRLESAISVTK